MANSSVDYLSSFNPLPQEVDHILSFTVCGLEAFCPVDENALHYQHNIKTSSESHKCVHTNSEIYHQIYSGHLGKYKDTQKHYCLIHSMLRVCFIQKKKVLNQYLWGFKKTYGI